MIVYKYVWSILTHCTIVSVTLWSMDTEMQIWFTVAGTASGRSRRSSNLNFTAIRAPIRSCSASAVVNALRSDGPQKTGGTTSVRTTIVKGVGSKTTYIGYETRFLSLNNRDNRFGYRSCNAGGAVSFSARGLFLTDCFTRRDPVEFDECTFTDNSVASSQGWNFEYNTTVVRC